jgi:hypothetical protein
MSIVAFDDFDGDPSPAELAAIDAEMPVITAEMKLLDVELAVMFGPRPVLPIDWTRVRAAEREVIEAWNAWLTSQPQTGEEAA